MAKDGRRGSMNRFWISAVVLLLVFALAHVGSAPAGLAGMIEEKPDAGAMDFFQVASASAQSPNCMEDVVELLDGSNAVPLNCTANDVSLELYHVLSGPPS